MNDKAQKGSRKSHHVWVVEGDFGKGFVVVSAFILLIDAKRDMYEWRINGDRKYRIRKYVPANP